MERDPGPKGVLPVCWFSKVPDIWRLQTGGPHHWVTVTLPNGWWTAPVNKRQHRPFARKFWQNSSKYLLLGQQHSVPGFHGGDHQHLGNSPSVVQKTDHETKTFGFNFSRRFRCRLSSFPRIFTAERKTSQMFYSRTRSRKSRFGLQCHPTNLHSGTTQPGSTYFQCKYPLCNGYFPIPHSNAVAISCYYLSKFRRRVLAVRPRN